MVHTTLFDFLKIAHHNDRKRKRPFQWVYQPTVWSQNLNTRNIYIDSMFILYTLYISSKKNLENHVERMIYFCLVKSS